MQQNLRDKVSDISFVEVHSANEKVTLFEFTEDDCRKYMIDDDFSDIPYLSSALFNHNGQIAVPIIKLDNGSEMRLADWRAENSLDKILPMKDFQDINKNVAFGLICDVAYLPPTNYKAIDSLLKNATPENKKKILGVIAEVVKQYPEESKGYIAHLMNDKGTGVWKKEVLELISIAAETEKHPKTDLEKVIEKHPKAFARAFLQNREKLGSDKGLEISTDKLTFRELKSLMKITDEIEYHTNSPFQSIADGIKNLINAFMAAFSKNAGLSNEAFTKAFEDIKSRDIQTAEKEGSALKAVLEERARTESTGRGA